MCRIGPDAKAGVAVRRYWTPALLASEIPEPDGDPVRVELLGETFVVFRDSNGNIGFLDEACCHRGASLYLGRVEGCGIRCIYHGWKFAVDGTVMETPNVHDSGFKTRFRAKAYPVREAGGLLWVYLGPANRQPRFPAWPWLSLPASNVLTTVHIADCNWVQVLEGLLDSTHLGLLHSDGLRASTTVDLDYAKKVGVMQADLAPRLQAEATNFGFHYAALRQCADIDSKIEARVTAYVAPFTVLNANGDIATIVVPIDDSRSLFFHAFWSADKKMNEEPLRSRQLAFVGLNAETLDAFGISRKTAGNPGVPSIGNRFHQNRDGMRAGRTFSGLPGIIAEDMAVSVSAGAIRDRSRERLSTADGAIQRLYRTLLGLAKSIEQGEAPIGLSPDVDDAKICGTNGVLATDQPWQSLVPGHVGREREPAQTAAE
jgi:nitrite reductase/ring-hydroxylating ferredoxin subunit